jgi:hypothetical protein
VCPRFRCLYLRRQAWCISRKALRQKIVGIFWGGVRYLFNSLGYKNLGMFLEEIVLEEIVLEEIVLEEIVLDKLAGPEGKGGLGRETTFEGFSASLPCSPMSP